MKQLTTEVAELDSVVAVFALQRRQLHRRRRVAILSAQILIAIGFLAAWQFLTGDPRTESWILVDSFYVSNPQNVAVTLYEWFYTGVVWQHITVTAQETLIGFMIGASLGLSIGLLLGSNRALGEVLNPFVVSLYSIPRLALVPLFVLWFGLGFSSKVIFVTVVVFFLVFFTTFSGVREVSPSLVNTLRVMGANRWHLLTKVTIPSAMTWMLTGLRVSVPYALVGAVTAEIVSSNQGLGYLLVRSSNQFYVQGVFAAILLMIILSLTMLGAVILLETRLLRWKGKER
jgi:NitT/TauT family transport system permease protein